MLAGLHLLPATLGPCNFAGEHSHARTEAAATHCSKPEDDIPVPAYICLGVIIRRVPNISTNRRLAVAGMIR